MLFFPDHTSFCRFGKDHGGIHPPFSPFAWRGEDPADCRKDGGYGVLSFFGGTSSRELVERVGLDDLALLHYRMDNKGLGENPQHGS